MIVARYNVFHKVIVGCTLASLLASCTLSNATTDGVELAIEQVSVASTQQTQIKIKALFSGTITPHYLTTLSALYTANNMQAMWQDEQAVKEFEQQLAELALAGFQPQFNVWVNWLADPQLTGMARDIILSDAMLGYLHYVDGVKEHGSRWLYQKTPYKLDIPATTSVSQWQVASKDNQALVKYVASLAPQQSDYLAMRKTMLLLANDEVVWPTVSFKKTVKIGNTLSAKDVEALQDILARTAAWSGDDAIKVSESQVSEKKYTQSLATSIKEFQRLHGLKDDGSMGKQTIYWLNLPPYQRAALMALNMQRLRLIPVKNETNIMVNIPDFSLVYYVDGVETLTSRVIVGRPDRKTPLMTNALTNVVLNPPWNVPTKLIREDIVPKVKRDPEYLKRQGYTVYSGWGRDSQVVDTSTIDWSEVSPKDVNFRFQQSPGGGNSLGRYKFNMPNSDAIYLHDTPNHRLFDKASRDLSSGCVRVNQSAKLASLLLNEVENWDDKKIGSTLKGGRTTPVNLSANIPVQLYYLTAWANDNSYPQFRNDIYSYDLISNKSAKDISQIRALLRK